VWFPTLKCLPPPQQIDDDAPWFCDMHPSPSLRSCMEPEEEEEEGGGQGSAQYMLINGQVRE